MRDIYGSPTVEGRAHATKHHYVAERFFGRTGNRKGQRRQPLFEDCPWGLEGQTAIYCYECHEELLHNPVFLPEDIANFAQLIRLRNLSEDCKSDDRCKHAERIKLLQEVISCGIEFLLENERNQQSNKT